MRSRLGYVFGGLLIAAAVVGAVAWFVLSLMRIGDEVDGFPRVPVPGQESVQLAARKYVVYYEGLSGSTFRMAVADAGTGVRVPVEPYGGSLTYSLSGHDGSAVGTVTPPREGPYAVRTQGSATTGANVAFGRSVAWPILRSILGTFVIGGVLLAAGVTLIVVTAVRRSRASRAAIG